MDETTFRAGDADIDADRDRDTPPPPEPVAEEPDESGDPDEWLPL